jgi:hypothetical protein
MSKEHRIDPQARVGLLAGPAGFPLEVRLSGGSKAETTTLIPAASAFAQRHGVPDMIVVADAGMLSAACPPRRWTVPRLSRPATTCGEWSSRSA